MDQSMLLEAKTMYKSQLLDALTPWLIGAFDDLWRRAAREPAAKRLVTFQRLLREVPGYNTATIVKHVNAVLLRKPYLMDLLAAVFLSSVKVLASVRLVDARKDIRVKVPTAEAFVHRCLEETAEQIYESILERRAVFQLNDKRAKLAMAVTGVERAIRDLMPVSELLRAYIGDEIDDQRTVSPEPLFHDHGPPPPSPSPAAPHDSDANDDHEDSHHGSDHPEDADDDDDDVDERRTVPFRSPAADGARPASPPAASTPKKPEAPPSPRAEQDGGVLFSDAEDDPDV